jgi:outer membrane protein assembly factor BamB
MGRPRDTRGSIAAAAFAAGVSLLTAPPRSAGQPPDAARAVHLSPAVLVDPDGGRAYVMNPGGGIDAITLDRGNRVWSTGAALKPLGLVGGRIVAQVANPAEPGRFRVVPLDRDSGRPTRPDAITVDVPPNVRPSVAETLQGRFAARATAAPDGKAVVSWQYLARPARGLATGAERRLLPVPPDEGAEIARAVRPPGEGEGANRGAVRIDLATGAVSPLEGGEQAAPLAPQAAQARAAGPVAAGLRLPSVDGRHFLIDQRTGPDGAPDRFTFTAYRSETGEGQGSFKSRLMVGPFVVADSRIIFETGAYTRRTESGREQRPREVRAVDLRTGQELWSHPVQELAPRGPHAP